MKKISYYNSFSFMITTLVSALLAAIFFDSNMILEKKNHIVDDGNKSLLRYKIFPIYLKNLIKSYFPNSIQYQ